MNQNRKSTPQKDQLDLFSQNVKEQSHSQDEHQNESQTSSEKSNDTGGKVISMSTSGRRDIYEKILERTMS